MKSALWVSAAVSVCALAGSAGAVNVLILSSSDSTLDAAVETLLESHGHSATLGPQWVSFDGTFDLSGFDVVYFQANANWNLGDMPQAGQEQLVSWVHGGGGLVTSEWVKWLGASGRLQFIRELVPASMVDSSYSGGPMATYAVVTPDPVLNAGVAESFEFVHDSYSGAESHMAPASGATVYYSTSTYPDDGAGVVGWSSASGRVISVSTCAGPTSLAEANFGRLLSNCMTWAAEGSCRADFDGDGFVTGLDFDAFVSAFEAGDPSSDFDRDGFVTGLDFDGFVSVFEAGCD